MSIWDGLPFVKHEDAAKVHAEVYGTPDNPSPEHKANLTHEAIAAAAGFAAMKAYEDHLQRTGEKPTDALMKELIAGFAAAEVDKLVETKGLDWIDSEREETKQRAISQGQALAKAKYKEALEETDPYA